MADLFATTGDAPELRMTEVAAVISTGAVVNRYVFGAALGSAVRKIISFKDFKVYGGLRGFCEKYLSDHIKWLGKTALHGGDNVFYVLDQSCQAMRDGWVAIGPSEAKRAWDFFSNPLIGGRLAVAINDTTVWASLSGGSPLPPDSAPVPVIESSAVDGLARAYVANCSPETKPQAQTALANAETMGENVSQTWPNVIRTASSASVFSEWEGWLSRTKVAPLAQAIPAAGIAPLISLLNAGTDIQGLRSESLSAQQRTTNLAAGKAPTREISATSSRSTGRTVGGQTIDVVRARALATAVIQQLSYEELRELKLPFGLVLDALLQK